LYFSILKLQKIVQRFLPKLN